MKLIARKTSNNKAGFLVYASKRTKLGFKQTVAEYLDL